MAEAERFTDWIRTGIGFAVWLVALLVLRGIILSLRAVQASGFAVSPLQSQIFPAGLAWITIIDVVFMTIFIFSMLVFGGRLDDALSSIVPQLPQLVSIGYLAIALVVVIIGYFTYDEIVVPLLNVQGGAWVYRAVFWLYVVGLSLGVLLQVGQTLFAVRKAAVSAIRIPGIPLDGAESSTRNCKECGGDD